MTVNSAKPLLLCVDDAEPALTIRKLMLQTNGFDVLTAHNCSEAIMLFGCNAVKIVVADHLLGAERGTTLAADLKRIRPGVPIVMLSGAEPESLANIDEFIGKGESVETVVAALRNLLAPDTLLLVSGNEERLRSFSTKLRAHLTLLTLEADSAVSASHLAKLYHPEYVFVDAGMRDSTFTSAMVSLVSPASHITMVKSFSCDARSLNSGVLQ